MTSVLHREPLRELPSSPTSVRVLRALTVETTIRPLRGVEIAQGDARRFVFHRDLVAALEPLVGRVVTLGPDGVTA